MAQRYFFHGIFLKTDAADGPGAGCGAVDGVTGVVGATGAAAMGPGGGAGGRGARTIAGGGTSVAAAGGVEPAASVTRRRNSRARVKWDSFQSVMEG